jgi:hypothetical protein
VKRRQLEATRRDAYPKLVWAAVIFFASGIVALWLYQASYSNIETGDFVWTSAFEKTGVHRFGPIMLHYECPKATTVNQSTVYRLEARSNNPNDVGLNLQAWLDVPDARRTGPAYEQIPQQIGAPGAEFEWDWNVTPLTVGTKNVVITLQVSRRGTKPAPTRIQAVDLIVNKDEPPFWSPSGTIAQTIGLIAAIVTLITSVFYAVKWLRRLLSSPGS